MRDKIQERKLDVLLQHLDDMQNKDNTSQLNRIEAKLQTNEDLQNFYDDIVKEVGL